MIEIIIIADDLVGAADTGVKFLDMAGQSIKMVGLKHKISAAPCGALALNTQTRHESRFTAKLTMDRAADLTRRFEPKIIYKKIDSCLRGHVGLELGALVRNLKFKGALVAPAYPTYGRLTKNGLHYVDNTLASESEIGCDPLCPVTDSRLEAVIGQDNTCTVCRLGLELIEKGLAAVTAALEDMLKLEGQVLIAADAASEQDLDILAEAGLKFKDRLIFTGSAGLAGALARQLNTRPPEAPLKNPRGPILYFGASRSKTLAGQIDLLAAEAGVKKYTVDVARLIDSGGEMPLPARPGDGHLAVVLPPPLAGAPTSEDERRRLTAAFGHFAANMVRTAKPATIFISNGDTAQAILSSLNLNELWLRQEILPGMVYMEAGKLSVITKAGSFGAPDILVKLHQSLQ